MRTTTSPVFRLALLALLAAGAQTGPVAAQPVGSDALFSDFQPSGDFVVEIDGRAQPRAEIYQSDRAGSLLLIGPELSTPILINLRAQTVEALDLMKVAKQPDGSVDLLADAMLSPLGRVRLEGEDLAFSAESKTVRIKARPFLIGAKSLDEVLGYSPEYQRKASRYAPDAGAMKRLKAQKEPVRVLTFFGSWCSHCKKHLPLLLKVGQGLGGGKFQFDFFGLPPRFNGEPEATKFGVTGVPTAILFVGGKEIGRIPAAQWSNPEIALDLLLNGPQPGN